MDNVRCYLYIFFSSHNFSLPYVGLTRELAVEYADACASLSALSTYILFTFHQHFFSLKLPKKSFESPSHLTRSLSDFFFTFSFILLFFFLLEILICKMVWLSVFELLQQHRATSYFWLLLCG